MSFEWIQDVWRPAVEITILAVGIYYASMFVRGTRGAPVVTGFFVLMVALALVTLVLNLPVLRWLLGTGFVVLTMAGIVIFQPELRRMMAEIGQWSMPGSVRERRENLEDIVQAVERLSELRIGALIAIQQSIDLQEAVESGVEVDCEVTPEMIETIFFPNNPIHDGGVIVVNDRISHAACIYPLTQRQDLSKSLGTRHRAAIGLSEETDAVVIVVSEETSSIAYAYKGQMVRGLTIEELRLFLTGMFIKTDQSKGVMGWWRSLERQRTAKGAPALAKRDGISGDS